tara:strand:- start:156 stop:1115 length:960 start_codon:yes stop_codon:yes gene_type:complete
MSLNPPLAWQGALWERLVSEYGQNRLPHALLLSGAAHIGKKHFAFAVAHRLLCHCESTLYACGTCKGCLLNEAQTHPDLAILEPNDAGKKVIGIGEVRELINVLSKTSQQGGWKVAVIAPVENLTISGANALLKTLEEPPGKILMLLVSHELGRVPATIRSRCQRYMFPLPNASEVLPWLAQNGVALDKAAKVLNVARGRPLLAADYLQESLLDRVAQFDQWVDDVASGQLSPVSAAQKCHNADALEQIDWFVQYIHRMVCLNVETCCSPENFIFYDKLHKARGWIVSGANANKQLIWEELFFDWHTLARGLAKAQSAS